MVKLYTEMLLIAAIILGVSAAHFYVTTFSKKTKLYTSIVHMFIVAMFTCVFYMMAISGTSYTINEVGYALFFSSIDWLLISMLFYTRQYTRLWMEASPAVSIYILIGIADNISLLTNFISHHAYNLVWTNFSEGDGCYLFVPNDYFIVHICYCYILSFVILLIFAVKAFKTGGIHKARYMIVFFCLLIIVAVDAFCVLFSIRLDMSVVLYAIAALFVGHYSKSRNSFYLAEAMLGTITERMDCAILAFDENDSCIYVNQLAGRIFGIGNTKVLVEDFFRRWRDGKDVNSIQDTNWNDVYEVNGEECHFDIHFTKMYDRNGHYTGCYFSFYDVTSDYVAYEEEKYRACHDSLTGAFNREGFYEDVRRILEAYPTDDFVMVCSDIKGFKLINDMFGLDRGDKVLVKIADIIRSRIRSGATFARLEADRFAVFMPKERYSEELFFKGMSEVEYVMNNAQYRMNILVGVYEVVDRSTSVATMCDRAFLAIDSIKSSYKTQIAYYGDMLRHEYMNEQKIIGEFETALSEGQFAMFLQPIVKSDESCNFAEALVRWVHPVKGILPPGNFVPVLENTGYIFKLDIFIWEQACKKLAIWKSAGREDMSISVNISVKDFYYIDIYETLTELVEKYSVDPKSLKLEITESVFMTEKERQLDIIYALKDYGFIVEIDDFGSGYSSLNMLKEVPANVLKVDMVFLEDSGDKQKSQTIVKAVIELAKALDMRVVVEGVENEEQKLFLTEAGCDLFQGYYFDKPLSVKSFEEKYMQ